MPLRPPDDPGKLPRKADALRGNIARLVSANRDRVANVETEARQERERQAFRRRLRALAGRISQVTRAFSDSEFDTVLERVHDRDFTSGQLFDYVVSKLDMNCHGCGYLLRGLPPSGHCPECGLRYYTGVLDFDCLRHVLAEELEMPAATVDMDIDILSRLRELCAQEEDRKMGPLRLDED